MSDLPARLVIAFEIASAVQTPFPPPDISSPSNNFANLSFINSTSVVDIKNSQTKNEWKKKFNQDLNFTIPNAKLKTIHRSINSQRNNWTWYKHQNIKMKLLSKHKISRSFPYNNKLFWLTLLICIDYADTFSFMKKN